MKFATAFFALVVASTAASVAALREYDSDKWLWKDSNDKFYQPGARIARYSNDTTDVQIVKDGTGRHRHNGTDDGVHRLQQVDATMRDWASSSKRRYFYGTIHP